MKTAPKMKMMLLTTVATVMTLTKIARIVVSSTTATTMIPELQFLRTQNLPRRRLLPTRLHQNWRFWRLVLTLNIRKKQVLQ